MQFAWIQNKVKISKELKQSENETSIQILYISCDEEKQHIIATALSIVLRPLKKKTHETKQNR